MSVPFETSPALADLGTVTHGFFGRQGGVSLGEFASLNVSIAAGGDPNDADHNRERACQAIGRPRRDLVLLKQVHSATVATYTGPPDDTPIEADAMVTAHAGLALGILTADCVPILLADPVAKVIGAAHAGWKGAVDDIAYGVVMGMVSQGADPANIVAAVGPSISAANYEVGDDFKASLIARHPGAEVHFVTPPGGKPHFDLPGFVESQLRGAGVATVERLGFCTYAEPDRYFSHRYATHKGTRTGRQLSVIALR